MKILYVVNEARFFLSHRLPLGEEAVRKGFDVVVVTAPNTGEEGLAKYPFRHLPVQMSRSGFNLWQEIKTFRELRRVYREELPDIVHHVTIKPVLYGSFAARRSHVRAVVNAVPGMGFVFTRRGSRAAVLRAFVNTMYRIAFSPLTYGRGDRGRHAPGRMKMKVIFQNSEDLKGFLGHAIVKKEQTVLIRGSGVDLQKFTPDTTNSNTRTFLLVARMLRDKGLYEFAQAAQIVRRKHPDWRFVLAGDIDPGNPTSLSEQQLRQLEEKYGVQWVGHCEQVSELMATADVVCLPTFYREGVPKTLLEGAAAGKGLIASDIAGCREVITDGVTGVLVPPREVAPLADAMLRMGEDDQLRTRCGHAAREKAEAVFSIDDVVEHHFRVYDELLA